jgi:uncharacterized protein YbaR (Trm112 family)
VFDIDVLACPRCGGRLRLIAVHEASEATVSMGGHADTSRPCETANLRRAASREAAPESYNRP